MSKISALGELAEAPASTDEFVIVDKSDTTMAASGTTKRIQSQYVTIADSSTTVKGKVELATDAEAATSTDTVRALTPSNGQSIVAGATVAAAGKTTPVDADSIPLVDSAASNVLKKLTWENIKATLLTWLRLSTTIIPINAPQGFLINGKIVPSVTSNNLTVALKTLAGTDPSASDPVYCRIGDTVRSITAALSTTSAAGEVAVLNSSSAELATKEIDYFVYLFFKASDSSIKIGFSRYPGGNIASDFGAWNTEKGLYDKSAMGIAASDTGELIGRFAATNSGSASYNWSVPTFTAANLIQRPIYTTRELDYVSVLSVAAGTSPTYTTQFVNKYRVSMDAIWVFNQWNNTAGGTAGAGTGVLYSTFPFSVSNYVANRSPVGSGWSHEGAGGTESVVTTVAGSAANNFNMYYGGNAILGNDQSSADRSISVTHSFKI